jgi:hypothetical protein
MPQAAVRIAPSPLAASASSGAEARAVAEAGPGLHPDEHAGVALLAAAGPVAAADDAPGVRGAVAAMPTDSGSGGRPFPESRLPEIDEAGRGAAPRGSA